MSRWFALAPLAVLALLAVLFAGYALHHDPHVAPAALVGRALPPRPLPTLDGGAPRSLKAELQGQNPDGQTLVNAFASWCVPCVEENPALLALKAEGVRIVGVAYKDDPAATRAFLDKYGDPFAAVLVDRDGRMGVDLGISGVPETFVAGPDGVVRAKHVGPLAPADADALLTERTGPH